MNGVMARPEAAGGQLSPHWHPTLEHQGPLGAGHGHSACTPPPITAILANGPVPGAPSKYPTSPPAPPPLTCRVSREAGAGGGTCWPIGSPPPSPASASAGPGTSLEPRSCSGSRAEEANEVPTQPTSSPKATPDPQHLGRPRGEKTSRRPAPLGSGLRAGCLALGSEPT